ncbi:PHM/PNGase F domain-containing protein [Obelidium mucronatum]|nr:PHM/PNGase F domain-containing protein [Obelidium mucronatum]
MFPWPVLTLLVASGISSVLAASCFSNLSSKQFTNCQVIAPTFALHWTANSSVIVFGVDVDIPSNSNSWVGLGVSQMGGMFGADLWILLKNSTTGKYYIQDSFASSTLTPVADVQQDAFLLTAPPASATNTVFTFMRPIKTCDAADYEIVEGVAHHIVYAWGQSTTAFGYHGPTDRGNTVLTLLSASLNSTAGVQKEKAQKAVHKLQLSSSLQSLEIRFPNVTVPSQMTSYLCVHFEVPSDQKYHVVEFEGIVTTSVVHHMIMYGCYQKPASFGDVYDCARMESACSQVPKYRLPVTNSPTLSFIVTLAWVPGAGMQVYPAEAGFAIGTGVSAIKYFSLQIHYNNQDYLQNLIDSSGMRIFYTTQLRPNDIGVLTLGSQEIRIPGNSPNYTSTPWSVCPSGCTQQFTQNLTVVSNGFHMHALGYNVTTRQIRNGKELRPLGVRSYYNFYYQGSSPPDDSNTVIMPGDTLLTQCYFLPTERIRTNATKFGESTNDEMCFNFVTYYPAMPNIGVCLGNSKQGMASCSTEANLVTLNSSTALIGVAKGWIVSAPFPSFANYTPPVCKQSFSRNIYVPNGGTNLSFDRLILVLWVFAFVF